MRMTSVNKVQFAGLNDKRYYFSDGITFLPYGHFLLADMRENKKQYKAIHMEINNIKYDPLRDESKACTKFESIRILRSILAQGPAYFKIDSNKRPLREILQTTKEYILNGYWQ